MFLYKCLSVPILGAAFFFCATGCDDPPNKHLWCNDGDGTLITQVCLEYFDVDTPVMDGACRVACQKWKEGFGPNAPEQDVNCNAIETETAPDGPECVVDIDWSVEVLGDPESENSLKYSCTSPVQGQLINCPFDVDGDGEIETNEYFQFSETGYQGCGHNADEGTQSCIDNCREQTEDFNAQLEEAGANCTLPITLCDQVGFAIELQGQYCDSAGLVTATGDYAENFSWPTSNGDQTTRPLACSLSGDCCESFGPEACININQAREVFAVADTRTKLKGTLQIRSLGEAPVETAIAGFVRSSAQRCENAAGVCPLYLEEVVLNTLSPVRNVSIGGVRSNLQAFTILLDSPSLGVVHSESGLAKWSDFVPMRVKAAVEIPSAEFKMRIDELLTLDEPVDARLDSNGNILSINASLQLSEDVTVTISVRRQVSRRAF